jgi:hypothetical protein
MPVSWRAEARKGARRDDPAAHAARLALGITWAEAALFRRGVGRHGFMRLKTRSVWPVPGVAANSVGRSLPMAATQLFNVSPSSS